MVIWDFPRLMKTPILLPVRKKKKKIQRLSIMQPIKLKDRDFPGGPVAKTPHFQCTGCGFDPWSGN